MCNGFGCIVTKELTVHFTAPDANGDISHSEILKALHIEDNRSEFIRPFVRVECDRWDMGSFHLDEPSSLPGWAEANYHEIIDKVKKIIDVTRPFYDEFDAAGDAAYKKFFTQFMKNSSRLSYGAITVEHQSFLSAKNQNRRNDRIKAAHKLFIEKLSKVPGYVPPVVQ